MKIILKKDYDLLGDAGQVMEVKDGYARNFLIPNGIATAATSSNIKHYDETKRQQGRKMLKLINDAKTLAGEIEKHKINITVRTGEDNKVFGSVTSQMIADELTKLGFAELDRRKIHLTEPIKTLGDHEVDIRLMKDVIAKVKVHVGKEGGDDEVPEVNNGEVKAEETNTEAPAESTEETTA
ncbi:MAG: 50S ribosomal protein L9 [Ignavibacteria bacterium]|jgi:large subunit ribosomal protein L9|nr:50S ribosomal protein L9 [Ignavibacteria bacterium]